MRTQLSEGLRVYGRNPADHDASDGIWRVAKIPCGESWLRKRCWWCRGRGKSTTLTVSACFHLTCRRRSDRWFEARSHSPIPRGRWNPRASTGLLWRECPWWWSQDPRRIHPWLQQKSWALERKRLGCSLGLRRLKGEGRGYGECPRMAVQLRTVKNYSLQIRHHAVLVPLIAFPAKRMCSHVPWAGS